MEYKTIKLILNKIEVKPIRTRKQINKKEKIRKNIQRIKNNGKTKVSLKTKKQIVVCVYLFSWKNRSSKRQTKLNKKKCYLPVLRTTHANNTQKKENSDIVADTQTTQAKKTCKNTAKMKLQYSELYFSPDIYERNLVKSINNKKWRKLEVGTSQAKKQVVSVYY